MASRGDTSSDSKEIFQRIIGYMNEQRPDTLLLFAWNLFGYKNASQATMTAIDNNSFTLVIKNKSFIPIYHHNVTKTYNFNPPLLNPNESRDRLVRLSEKYSYCPWPSGGAGYITVGIWIALIFSMIQAKELLEFQFFRTIRNYALKLFGSAENAAFIFVIMIVLHVAELIYNLYLLKDITLTSAAKQSWVYLILLLGLPVTMQVFTLSSVAAKKSKKNV